MIRRKNYKTLGYVHKLQNEYPDPISHFKEVVSQMNAVNAEDNKLTLMIDMNEKLPNESNDRYNMFYFALKKEKKPFNPFQCSGLGLFKIVTNM